MAHGVVIFTATLTRLSFSEPTRNYLNAQNLTIIKDLLTLPVGEIDKLFKHAASQRPGDNVPGSDDAAPTLVSMIPFLAARKFKAQYCVLWAQQPNPAIFDNAAIDWVLDCLSELADLTKAQTDDANSRSPPVLAVMTKWLTWLEHLFSILGSTEVR
jgi:hypothetical protein